ncbi:hypothetical protein Pcinc_019783 [Petrolisthes cinctipes]|uniref:PiggyBac transposable element-derived protein domain-containing protein n=1 Tax=Petrolisthes cinctipes TaxID=88211 RepID=A0AAE1FJG1_PETCI|nr:hypothetical protein Pcinc_019783 [Petrolisthes cinctipes]
MLTDMRGCGCGFMQSLRQLFQPSWTLNQVHQESTLSVFYKTGRKSRPRYVQVPLCTSDTEDIDEYAVDEVDDSYSPHESDEEEYSAAEDDTVVLEVDSSTLASPPQLQSTSKSVRKRKSRQFWTHIRERDEAPTIPIYDILNYNDDDEEGISRPIDLFRQFLTDDILNIIVEQSNLYAIQENANKPLDLDRIRDEDPTRLYPIIHVPQPPPFRKWFGIT